MPQSSHKGKGRDAGRSHDRPNKSKKDSKHAHPGAACHCSEQPCGDGGPGCFKCTADAILALRLAVVPSPRPGANDPGFAQWLEDYHGFWRDATCPCGRGYFCQEHGRWISGSRLSDMSHRNHDRQGHPRCRMHGPRDVSPPPVRVSNEDESSSASMSGRDQSTLNDFYPSHYSTTTATEIAPLYYDEDAGSNILEHHDTTNTHSTSYLSEADVYPSTSSSRWMPQAISSYERGSGHEEVYYSTESASSAHVSSSPYSRQVRGEDPQSISSASYDAYDLGDDVAYDYRAPGFD